MTEIETEEKKTIDDQMWDDLLLDLHQASRDMEALVTALNYYADREMWKAKEGETPEAVLDGGEIARHAVARYAIWLKRRRTQLKEHH